MLSSCCINIHRISHYVIIHNVKIRVIVRYITRKRICTLWKEEVEIAVVSVVQENKKSEIM